MKAHIYLLLDHKNGYTSIYWLSRTYSLSFFLFVILMLAYILHYFFYVPWSRTETLIGEQKIEKHSSTFRVIFGDNRNVVNVFQFFGYVMCGFFRLYNKYHSSVYVSQKRKLNLRTSL